MKWFGYLIVNNYKCIIKVRYFVMDELLLENGILIYYILNVYMYYIENKKIIYLNVVCNLMFI